MSKKYVPSVHHKPHQHPRPQRDFDYVLAARADGRTFQYIADQLGISKQRAITMAAQARHRIETGRV
jgi:hypothetical protein